MKGNCPVCSNEVEIPAGKDSIFCGKCNRDYDIKLLSTAGADDVQIDDVSAGLVSGNRPEQMDTDQVFQAGTVVGQYEIQEFIGKGGMGAVYKAKHLMLDRIVAIFDMGTQGELYYFAMEYIEGTNLRTILATQKLSPEQALEVVPKLCDALEYAHGLGVVHRDIKPENILMDKKGEPKIADFGLAKLVQGEKQPTNLTMSGEFMGTEKYMAPEQFRDPKKVDHRADIYSLGAVFYEMLTGEIPIGKFKPPSKKVKVDVRLDKVVLKALESEPELRYQRASYMGTDVRKITDKGAFRGIKETIAGGASMKEKLEGLDDKQRKDVYQIGIFVLLFIAALLFGFSGLAVIFLVIATGLTWKFIVFKGKKEEPQKAQADHTKANSIGWYVFEVFGYLMLIVLIFSVIITIVAIAFLFFPHATPVGWNPFLFLNPLGISFIG